MMTSTVSKPQLPGELYTQSERARIFFAAGLGWALEFFDLMLVSLLASQIAASFGLTVEAIGIVFTAQLIATALGGLIFGRLADLYGRKRVLGWTIWIFGLASVACAFAPNLAVFILLRVITGIGVGGEWSVGFSLLNEAWAPKRRGLAGGFVQALIWPAYAAAIFVTGFVHDWRIAFIIGGAPVLLAIWVRLKCPESKQWLKLQGSSRVHVGDKPARVRFRDMLKRPTLIRTLIIGTVVVFGAQYSYYVYSSWMPTYLKDDLGISGSHAQSILYISAVVAFVAFVACGALGDVVGRRTALITFAAIQTCGFIGFIIGNTLLDSISLVVISYYVISFGLGYFGIFGAWFGEIFSTDVRAFASGAAYSVGRGVASFGPSLVAILAAHFGLAGGISTGLLAVVLMVVCSFFLANRAGREITASE